MEFPRNQTGFLLFNIPVGGSYELRGHFSAVAEDQKAAGFGVALRASRIASHQFLKIKTLPSPTGTTTDSTLTGPYSGLSEGGRKRDPAKAPARKDNEFLVRITPSSVAFDLNGEAVIPPFETTRYPRGEYLALVAERMGTERATKVSGLEIRKTDQGR